MDIMAPSPISALATIAAHSSVSGAPDVNRVETRPGAERTETNTNTANGQGQADNAADYRMMRNRSETGSGANGVNIDPYTQTGPTPSFQITLLEVEQDLQTILARIEVNRAKDSNAQAIRPAEPADVAARTDATKANMAEGQAADQTKHTHGDSARRVDLAPQQGQLTHTIPLSQTEVQPNTPQIALAEAAKPDVIPI